MDSINNCIPCTKKVVTHVPCDHHKRKSRCVICEGNEICEHKKRIEQCRLCENIIKKTFNMFVKCSKTKDKKYNRFDIVNFIDRDFLKLLIEESNNKCCYCTCELELIKYQSNLMTIERIDNTIGHIKSNVKIACLSCNSKRIGDKTT